MNESKIQYRDRQPPREPESHLAGAPRQPSTPEAWGTFAGRLVGALMALEEDEYLFLEVKGTDRYVQFMDQGGYGMRAESVSDYYLDDGDHLGEDDYRRLLRLSWHAPTQVPGTTAPDPEGPPNYFVDVARPLPLVDLANLAVFTLMHVHGACHPAELEYDARSTTGMSIRFPHLIIRRRPEPSRA
jgi:hypothetical protein